MIEIVDMEAVGDHDECCGHCESGCVMRPGCGAEEAQGEDAQATEVEPYTRAAADLFALRRYLAAMSSPSATAERLAARDAVHPDDLATIERWEGLVNREHADVTAERDEAHRARIDAEERREAARVAGEEAARAAQAEVKALREWRALVCEALDGGSAPAEEVPRLVGWIGQKYAAQTDEIRNLRASLAEAQADLTTLRASLAGFGAVVPAPSAREGIALAQAVPRIERAIELLTQDPPGVTEALGTLRWTMQRHIEPGLSGEPLAHAVVADPGQALPGRWGRSVAHYFRATESDPDECECGLERAAHPDSRHPDAEADARPADDDEGGSEAGPVVESAPKVGPRVGDRVTAENVENLPPETVVEWRTSHQGMPPVGTAVKRGPDHWEAPAPWGEMTDDEIVAERDDEGGRQPPVHIRSLPAPVTAPPPSAKGCHGCHFARDTACAIPAIHPAAPDAAEWSGTHLEKDKMTPRAGAPECPGRGGSL